MSFVRRRINLRFQLGQKDFGLDGMDQIDLEGLRCSVEINIQGANANPHLDLHVFGMTLDQMHRLTLLNTKLLAGRFNIIQVFVGDDDKTSLCFQGGITEAWADLQGAPEGAFHVSAEAGLINIYKPAPPTSFKGSVDVTTILQSMAEQMTPPRQLEKNGVSVQISDPYYPGTLHDQVQAVTRHARITHIDDGQTLAVYPDRGSRTDLGIIEINKDTGMIGYPTFAQNAVNVQTTYNPEIKCGQKAKITSVLQSATGSFNIYQMIHHLESETPDGAWFTDLMLQLENQEAPVPRG